MNYKTVSDLAQDTRRLAEDLPENIDVVVGIPRSGLLAANLLCLYLDVPMTDVDGLCRGAFLDTGKRHGESVSLSEVDTALVFDDSVWSGAQMTQTKRRLGDEQFAFDIEYGAVYIRWNNHSYVDHWCEVVPDPRVFEWNVMHHDKLQHCCVGVEGVLCRNPRPEEAVDEETYRRYVSEVDAKNAPNEEIGWIVTSRSEAYRDETERWLADHGIEYDTLVMADETRTRRRVDEHAAYKATVYEDTEAMLFIEGSPQLAPEIRERTRRPVYCYETNEMLTPGRISRVSRRGREYASRFRERPFEVAYNAGRYALRRSLSRTRRWMSD